MKIFWLPLICVQALSLTHATDHQPDHHLVKYRDLPPPGPPPGYGSRRVKTNYNGNSRKISPAYNPKPLKPYGPPKFKKNYYSENPPNFDYGRPTGPSGYNYKNKAFIPPSDTDLLSFPTNHYGGPPKSFRQPYPSFEEPSKYRGPPKRSPNYESSSSFGFNKFGLTSPGASNHFDRPPLQYGPPDIISGPSKIKTPFNSYKASMYIPKGPNPGFIIPDDLSNGYFPPKGPPGSYGPPKPSPLKPSLYKDTPQFLMPPKNKFNYPYFAKDKKPNKIVYHAPPKPIKPQYGPPTGFGSNDIRYPTSSSKYNQKPMNDFPSTAYGIPGTPLNSYNPISMNNIPLTNYNPPTNNIPLTNYNPPTTNNIPLTNYNPPTANNNQLTNYNTPTSAFSSHGSTDYSYSHNNHGTSSGFQYQTPHLSYSFSNNPPSKTNNYTPDAPPSQYNSNDLNFVKQPESVSYELPQKSISYEFHTITNENPQDNGNKQQGSYSSYHPIQSDKKMETDEQSNRYVRGSVTSVSPHTTQEEDDQLKNVEIHLQSSKKPPMGFSKPTIENEKDFNGNNYENESIYGKKITNQEMQSQS